METNKINLSAQAFQRLPYYLQFLKNLYADGNRVVSAPTAAEYFSFTEVQVRKDFSTVSPSQGKPRQGFDIKELIDAMEKILGNDKIDEAVLVGTGSLGHALLSHGQFKDYGLSIRMAFDTDPQWIGTEISGVQVLSAQTISSQCRKLKIHIGIITVPKSQAQITCDQLIAGGIAAIWNFSPVHLLVPEGILVQNENLAASLALLVRRYHEKQSIRS